MGYRFGRWFGAALMACVCWTAPVAWADVVIVQDSGGTNPNTLGFVGTYGGSAPGTAVNGAWVISNGAWNTNYALLSLTNAQIASLTAAPTWTFTTTLSNLSTNISPTYPGAPDSCGSDAAVSFAGIRITLGICADGKGNQVLTLDPFTGAGQYVIQGAGTSPVTLSFVYNNSTHTGDAYVNGTDVIQGFKGGTEYTGTFVLFGGENGSFTNVELSYSTSAATPPGPSINAGGIVNAASYAASNGAGAPVAPGSLVAIFTSALSAQAASFTTASLPNSLGGVSVTFNGITSPMVQVAPSGAYPFVSVQVPFEVLAAGQSSATVPVVINVNGVSSAAVQTKIVASQPGIFTLNAEGTGQALLVNLADYTIAAPSGSSGSAHPIPRGQPAYFYVTGLGAMSPTVTDGSGVCPAANGLCNAVLMPSVLVGGVPAQVTFAGQAPGYPGVSQINLTIPATAPTGSAVSLIVLSGDGSVLSNGATIAVQ